MCKKINKFKSITLAIFILSIIPYEIDLTSIALHIILKLYICVIRKRYIAMGKVILEGFQCERCKHIWVPRTTTEGEPTICPKCNHLIGINQEDLLIHKLQ